MAILVSACCSTEYVKIPTVVPIAVLADPVLPTLTPEQEATISNEVFVELSAREETLIQHIKRQREIIRIHNKPLAKPK